MLSITITIICCGLFIVLESAWEYWLLSILLAAAGTGTFIFTRVLMADLTPTHKAGRNFGVLAGVNKMAGFVGPLLYSFVSNLFGSPRAGFIFLILLAVMPPDDMVTCGGVTCGDIW